MLPFQIRAWRGPPGSSYFSVLFTRSEGKSMHHHPAGALNHDAESELGFRRRPLALVARLITPSPLFPKTVYAKRAPPFRRLPRALTSTPLCVVYSLLRCHHLFDIHAFRRRPAPPPPPRNINDAKSSFSNRNTPLINQPSLFRRARPYPQSCPHTGYHRYCSSTIEDIALRRRSIRLKDSAPRSIRVEDARGKFICEGPLRILLCPRG